MTAYAIAGTGTDVGKTFVTCALLHAQPTFRACKPVISGFTGDDTDTHWLIAAMGRGNIDDVSPWRYRAPLSPDMAAAAEGTQVPYDAMVAWTRAQATSGMLIESVGGVMVPFDAQHTTRDWLVALGLPVILVTGSYLGSISHTLTALEVLKSAQLTVRALVVSESANSTVALADTLKTLSQHTSTLIVAQPRVSSYRDAQALHALAKELV